jgi:hypothetical protein
MGEPGLCIKNYSMVLLGIHTNILFWGWDAMRCGSELDPFVKNIRVP